MFVIVGFNDQTKEFIVNDNGLEDGLDYTYSYAIIADALADFNQKTYKTDGPPTAIFTRPKP
jgi:predicted secreted protein